MQLRSVSVSATTNKLAVHATRCDCPTAGDSSSASPDAAAAAATAATLCHSLQGVWRADDGHCPLKDVYIIDQAC
jgi:hypothetical protein